jgi:hypothetical protein
MSRLHGSQSAEGKALQTLNPGSKKTGSGESEQLLPATNAFNHLCGPVLVACNFSGGLRSDGRQRISVPGCRGVEGERGSPNLPEIFRETGIRLRAEFMHGEVL